MPPLHPTHPPSLVSQQCWGFTVSTANLEDFQQMGSPPSSHLLCSCLSLIFISRYLRQAHPSQQPSGKNEMPHSSLSTQRCSASTKGARTEDSYLLNPGQGGMCVQFHKSMAICPEAELTAAVCLLFWTAKSFQTVGAASQALPCVWVQCHRHSAVARHHSMSCLSPKEDVGSGVPGGTRLTARSTGIIPLSSVYPRCSFRDCCPWSPSPH